MTHSKRTEELVYEYWDCSYCGVKSIRGDEQSCTGCNQIRGKNVKFYRLADREEIVQNQQDINRFSHGADWNCQFCDKLNPALNQSCEACGANCTVKADTPGTDPRVSSVDSLKNLNLRQVEAPPVPDRARARRKSKSMAKVFGLVILAVVGWQFARTAIKSEVIYEVSKLKWERTRLISRYQEVEKTDWKDAMRGDDIKILSESRKVRSHKKVQVGTKTEVYTEVEEYQSGTEQKCDTSYESTGAGAAKKVTECNDVPKYASRKVEKRRQVPQYKNEPIYDTEVRYLALEYKPHQTFTGTGTGNTDLPQWPEVVLGVGEKAKPDVESAKIARYFVTLKKMKKKDRGPDLLHVETNENRFLGFFRNTKRLKIPVSLSGSPELSGGDRMNKASP